MTADTHINKYFIFVSLQNSMSHVLVINAGVRQGGVLAPLLFSVYMDNLIDKLEACGYGCKVHGVYVECILYADDITLTPLKRSRTYLNCSTGMPENKNQNRHFLSALYASLNVLSNHWEAFYKHMGHSSTVNKNIYQAPLAKTEIFCVGSVLLCITRTPYQHFVIIHAV